MAKKKSDKSNKVKVDVNVPTAFLMGAKLGKGDVETHSKAWAEKNPLPVAQAWAEQNKDAAAQAWAEGNDKLKQSVKAWVSKNPDEVAFAWAHEKSKNIGSADFAWYEDPPAKK